MISGERSVQGSGAATDTRLKREHFRLSPADLERVRALTGPDGRKFIPWMLLWLCIWLALAAALSSGIAWPWKVPLAFAMGSVLHTFTILHHDCGHGSGFKSKVAVLWVGRFLGWFTVMPYSTFTEVHRRHHLYLGQPDKDPDEPLWEAGPRGVFVRVASSFFPHYLRVSLRDCGPEVRGRVIRELVFNVATWVLVGVAAWRAGRFDAFLWVFIAPLAALTFVFNSLARGFEHLPMTRFSKTDPRRYDYRYNTVSVHSRLISLIWANINFHVEHHLFPTAPWYNLPAIRELLRGKEYVRVPFYFMRPRADVLPDAEGPPV